jgi:C4-dicarboxylate-specific signal transduction histidine kinase
MASERPYRRLPLRDLLTDAEKRSRDTAEKIHAGIVTKLADLRELSRPVRRKSHYPTLVALQNSLQKVLESAAEMDDLIAYMERQLTEIRDHARRERFNRN